MSGVPPSQWFDLNLRMTNERSLIQPIDQAAFLETCRSAALANRIAAISMIKQSDLGLSFFRDMVAGSWQTFPHHVTAKRFRVIDEGSRGKSARFLANRIREFAAGPDSSERQSDIVLWAIDTAVGNELQRKAGLWFESGADAFAFRLEYSPGDDRFIRHAR